jgi:hypothetical protein
LVGSLSTPSFLYWDAGWHGILQKVRRPLFLFVESKMFGNLMTLCVILNTIVLAMDHHGISSEWEDVLTDLNFTFTIIFIVEMGLKLLGLGVRGYCSDAMNYVDGFVVILSLVELIFLEGSSSAVSAFRTIRIFRTFRVLRVARLFRYLKQMAKILRVIANSINNFANLALLLLLFILIFALLGM